MFLTNPVKIMYISCKTLSEYSVFPNIVFLSFWNLDTYFWNDSLNIYFISSPDLRKALSADLQHYLVHDRTSNINWAPIRFHTPFLAPQLQQWTKQIRMHPLQRETINNDFKASILMGFRAWNLKAYCIDSNYTSITS